MKDAVELGRLSWGLCAQSFPRRPLTRRNIFSGMQFTLLKQHSSLLLTLIALKTVLRPMNLALWSPSVTGHKYIYFGGRYLKVMIDFQAAEKKRHEEPASEVGLEPLCAMINNNLRCYDLAMELSNSTLEALPQNYAEQDQELCLITQQKSKDADKKNDL